MILLDMVTTTKEYAKTMKRSKVCTPFSGEIKEISDLKDIYGKPLYREVDARKVLTIYTKFGERNINEYWVEKI